MLKRRGRNRFRVISTWNTHGVFAGKIAIACQYPAEYLSPYQISIVECFHGK